MDELQERSPTLTLFPAKSAQPVYYTQWQSSWSLIHLLCTKRIHGFNSWFEMVQKYLHPLKGHRSLKYCWSHLLWHYRWPCFQSSITRGKHCCCMLLLPHCKTRFFSQFHHTCLFWQSILCFHQWDYSVADVLSAGQPDDLLMKSDLSSGFFPLWIAEKHEKYYGVYYNQCCYTLIRRCFGYHVVPYILQCMAQAVVPILHRRDQVAMVTYLDN
jgi:hypothetical protein